MLSLKARQKWKTRGRHPKASAAERASASLSRAQAFDGAAQYLRREPSEGWLGGGDYAGVCSQQARGEKIRQLLPEQGIQSRAALKGIRSTQKQSGRDEVGMRSSVPGDRRESTRRLRWRYAWSSRVRKCRAERR